LNPCRAIIPEIDTCDRQERKPITLEEVANLLAAAATLSNSRPKQIRTPEEQAEAEATAAEWCGLILAAAFTGLRLEDTARLKWESVCLETEKITLIPSKTRKKKREVKIPIQSDLMAFLRSALIKRGDIYIFPRLAKMRVGSSNGLSATFVKIMAAAKVDRGKPSRVIK
jgi:integrase